jgi:hypothetical protein
MVELPTTDIKGSVIVAATRPQADELVRGLDDDEVKEWKDGVQKGVMNNNWADLIAHRTYHSASDRRMAFNRSVRHPSQRYFRVPSQSTRLER